MIDELRRLNDTWNRAWLEKHVAAVEHLMADDYVYVAPDGQVLNRQAILGTAAGNANARGRRREWGHEMGLDSDCAERAVQKPRSGRNVSG